jgi:uncharacterized damage-inducible protein DinB
MLAVFLHMLDDEEGWLQFAARGRSLLDGPDRQPGAYGTFDQVAEDDARVGTRTREFLAGLTEADLGSSVAFQDSAGVARRTVEKIAMHAFVDELAHVGELICLLWQLGVKPPYIDWLDYHVD